MKKNILAIIPARGGSKAIKNKNIIALAGKPLISYVIDAAKKSKFINKIVCSTDNSEIAEIAKKYGAEVPFLRPGEWAQDNSPVYPALVYTVKKLEEEFGYKADYIVIVQPTSPFARTENIDGVIRLAIDKNADSAITALELEHDCHPYNIREILPDGAVKFWMEEEHYKFPSRQMKPKFYKFGNAYVTSYKTLMETGHIEGKKNYVFEISKGDDFDINTAGDLKMAEILMSIKTNDNK